MSYNEQGLLTNSLGQCVEGLSLTQIKLGEYVDSLGRVHTFQGGYIDGLNKAQIAMGQFADELGNIYDKQGVLIKQSEKAAQVLDEISSSAKEVETDGEDVADSFYEVGEFLEDAFGKNNPLSTFLGELSAVADETRNLKEGFDRLQEARDIVENLFNKFGSLSSAARTAGLGIRALGTALGGADVATKKKYMSDLQDVYQSGDKFDRLRETTLDF